MTINICKKKQFYLSLPFQMHHILDNPAWYALMSGNRLLAHGSGPVRYFWNDVSPFAGLRTNSVEEFRALHETIPFDSPMAVVSPTEIPWPQKWAVIETVTVSQMVCLRTPKAARGGEQVVSLGVPDIPQMMALTKLTRPGPFEQKTLLFGHYEGVYHGDQLIAMTGQRMNPKPYAEISAVCTHPDFLGRGLATLLMSRQIHRMQSAGETPFLHVRADNERAIKVYTELGFEKRREILIYFVRKG